MSLEMENDPGWRYLRLSREQMTKEQSVPFDSKKDVWIPDKEEGFIAAKVVSTKGDTITVQVGGKEMTLKKDLISPMNPPKFEKTEDMSNLTILNDACVLHNLRSRYKEMLIYTYSGLFCVVINPYKRLPIYTDSVAAMYLGKRRTEMPPHLFAVSDEAYRNMLQDHENQSMLITGESGAGKTENTKKVIAYFASVGASQTQTAETGEKKVTLEDQIIQTNPVLEAFGNARTVRNNNSSRFGKFIRIHFSKLGKVASCDIEHYLLEKSRVIRQAPGERCYHIFYQMCSDYKPELKPVLLLDRPLRDYWFVAQAELTVDGMDDAEEFKLTDEAFDILHFSEEEKLNCYKLMAAHMHIGIMKFKQRPREEQAEPDGTDEAEKAAKMYGVETEDLLKSFTHPRVKVGNEWVNKGQNVDQVNWAVGAMGKAIYARVFHWLVKKCNITLDQKGISRDYFIGVLDIAGFEIFDFNSFEQLWINFVNEKLQQFFNHHMFVLEQEEYARENIEWTFIDFGLDLQACIELIEKPLGIISMLDEECIVPKATDMTLAQKLNEQHLGKHPNFLKPKPPKGKQAEAHFAMHHYAGIVRYNVTNWLEKNKDPLNDTVAACLKASPGNKLLNAIWEDYVTQEEASDVKGGHKKKGKSGSFMTVSMMYRQSLNNLMSMLYKTHPHFIRCIIPNEKKKSGLLDAALVLNQLTCNGVLEGIRICRKGFPNRTLHPDYVQRYAILCADESKSSDDPKQCAIKMLERLVNEGSLKEEMYRIGLTKVFFKAGVLAHLEDLRDERLSQILAGFQARIRFFFQQIDLKDRQQKWEATQLIQKNTHLYINAVTWNWFKLFINTMPIVRESKVEETLEQLKVDVAESVTTMNKKSDAIKALQESLARVTTERDALLSEIRNSRSGNLELEEQIDKIGAENVELGNVLSTANSKLAEEQQRTTNEMEARKRMEVDLENLRKTVQNIELSKRKSEAEKVSLESQIKALKEEIAQQDETIAKVSKEKKHQEEMAKKMEDDIKSEEERGVQGDSVRDKLKKMLEECEERFEREKRSRDDMDKAKRKADGALKIAQETMEELEKQRRDLESNLRKKEAEAHAYEVRIEDTDALTVRIGKQNKDDEARVQELEEAIENERDVHAKSERMRSEMQRELDEITNRLDEQNAVTGQQIETGKKHEAEIAKLRRDVESFKITQGASIAAARKKNSDTVSELNDQIAVLKKKKERAENDRSTLHQQLEQLHNQTDSEAKVRADGERSLKQTQVALSDMQMKSEEQTRTLDELAAQRHRLLNDNDQLKHQADDLTEQINTIARIKTQYVVQIEEAERTAAVETSETHNQSTNVKNLQREVDRLRDLLDDELDEKNQLDRQISKAEIELQQVKATLEDQGLVPNETIEDMKRKQESNAAGLQDALEAATAKLNDLEKSKLRLSIDADEASKEVERRFAIVTQLEKKHKQLEAEADEWKRKTDDLNNDLDAAQHDSRTVSAELYKEQGKNDNLLMEIEGMKRENKNISDEIADLQRQLGERSQSMHELQKTIHRLEAEKDDLQQMLDEAEAALEAEEIKVSRTQVEIKQTRAEAEKRVQEKEEEFENIRKNLQRNLEAIQANTENEKRERTELQKTCKKLQQDVTELDVALDHANEANEDAQKNLKRYAAQIGELQGAIDEEQRRREEARESFLLAEKSMASAQNEKENIISKVQKMERVKKENDVEISDLRAQIHTLEAQSTEFTASKKKLESDIMLLKNEMSEMYNELHAAEDGAKASAQDAARLSEQLRQTQEQSQVLERENKNMDMVIKEMQNKIDDAENVVLRGGQNAVAKLEQRMKALNLELENEKRRCQDTVKNTTKQERKLQEMEFQIEENKKKYAQMQEMAEKLQTKIKEQKKLIDEKEEDSSITLQKYKQLQAALENAEERAQAAEESLRMIRSPRSATATTTTTTAP